MPTSYPHHTVPAPERPPTANFVSLVAIILIVYSVVDVLWNDLVLHNATLGPWVLPTLGLGGFLGFGNHVLWPRASERKPLIAALHICLSAAFLAGACYYTWGWLTA